MEPSRFPKALNPRTQARAADKRSKKHDHANCERPPSVPDGLWGEYDGFEGERNGRLRLKVRWNEVALDSLGQFIRIRKYNLEWQHTPDDGASWRDSGRARVPAKSDDDANEKAHYIIHKIRGRLGYRYRVQAEATNGCQSAWSSYYDAGEAIETPPEVTNLTLDVDEHACHISWKIPVDTENPDVRDLRVTHVHVELFRDSISQPNLVDEDTFRKGEHAHFKLRQPPMNDTFFARARAISANGATSTAVTTSATKNTPSQPQPPSMSFDAMGPRHARFRANVGIEEVADTDFEIRGYRVEFVDKRVSGTPTNATDRDRRFIKSKGTNRELFAMFRGVPADFFTYARTQAVDKDNKESAWSGWTAGGKPIASDSIPALQNITYITARRRVGVKWKVPQVAGQPDERIAFVEVQIATDTGFVSIVDEGQHAAGHNTHRYAVPADQTGTAYRVRLRPLDGAGNAGAWQPNDTGQPLTGEPDEGLPPAPGAIASPSVGFDTQGTRYARYRALVTVAPLGTTVSDYPIHLVHTIANTGATPAAGAKRQHGRVEGDATGDDLTDIFKNIPKRHFVWVRARAMNAGGPGPWSSWVAAGTPLNSGSSIPATPTGVVVTFPVPRRLVAKWDDPDDDDVNRWAVTVRQGAAVKEDTIVKNNRFTYRVPKADVGLPHTVQVYALNQTENGFGSGRSLGTAQLPGIPTDDAGAVPVGSVHQHQGTAMPAGYLRCNGSLHQTSAFPALFAVIGNLYGGSGTSFAVPDYRKRSPRGVGDSHNPTYQVGNAMNVWDNDAQLEANRIEASDRHNDIGVDGNSGITGGAHTHNAGSINAGSSSATGNSVDNIPSGGTRSASGASHGHTITGDTGTTDSPHGHTVHSTNTGDTIRGVWMSQPGGGNSANEGHARRAYQRSHFIIRAVA